jgi:hypothetical protein
MTKSESVVSTLNLYLGQQLDNDLSCLFGRVPVGKVCTDESVQNFCHY